MGGKNGGISLLSLAVAMLFMFAMLIKPLSLNQIAYADNRLTFVRPPAQMIDGREVSIEIKTNPPILTSQSDKEVEIQFRLHDLETSEIIMHTTYLIRITKGFTDPSKPPLLADIFHSHNGTLILRIEPTMSAEESVSIDGEREPILNAWLADENQMIRVKAPFFLHAALYHLHVEIVTVDYDTNVLEQQEFPKFDQWISVSESVSKTIMLDNQLYNSTVISYFDRIENFTFNDDEKAFSWSIPFDWNTTITIQDQQPFYVHQHLIIPKSLFKVAFGEERSNGTATTEATINELPLNGSSFVIDPYSYENEIVYHILINKQKMLSLAENIPIESQSSMAFEVSQNSSVIPEFGIEMLGLLAVIMGTVILMLRYRKLGTRVSEDLLAKKQ